MTPLRIIFMGTPEFAVPSLELLLQHQYEVVAVITAPDRPKGRGRNPTPSPVKECALKHGIPVMQPTNLKDPSFLNQLKGLGANLQVVVAFRMLPEVVWSMPELGTFNLHGSLLPRYRGAAPIHWAVINGESQTGVTTFFLKQAIDTGNIILQETEPIHTHDTAGSLYQRLMKNGAKLVLKTVQLIESGSYDLIPQDLEENQPKAPKLFKSTCEIDWKKKAFEVYNFVRGLNPFPTAWTEISGTVYKIHEVKVISDNTAGDPGSYSTDGRSYLHFQTGKGTIAITNLQAPGKKKMNIQEFLRGNKL